MRVEVVDYDLHWPRVFAARRDALQCVLIDLPIAIEHIGKTEVPGLAKPVIDVLLEVTALRALDRHDTQMRRLGHEVMGEFDIKGRRYFRKGGSNRSRQVHAFAAGTPHLTRRRALRDDLHMHPQAANAPAGLKRRLAPQFNDDIRAYGERKDAFIKPHEALALAWTAAQAGIP